MTDSNRPTPGNGDGQRPEVDERLDNDPLAELARLVSEENPFSTFEQSEPPTFEDVGETVRKPFTAVPVSDEAVSADDVPPEPPMSFDDGLEPSVEAPADVPETDLSFGGMEPIASELGAEPDDSAGFVQDFEPVEAPVESFVEAPVEAPFEEASEPAPETYAAEEPSAPVPAFEDFTPYAEDSPAEAEAEGPGFAYEASPDVQAALREQWSSPVEAVDESPIAAEPEPYAPAPAPETWADPEYAPEPAPEPAPELDVPVQVEPQAAEASAEERIDDVLDSLLGDFNPRPVAEPDPYALSVEPEQSYEPEPPQAWDEAAALPEAEPQGAASNAPDLSGGGLSAGLAGSLGAAVAAAAAIGPKAADTARSTASKFSLPRDLSREPLAAPDSAAPVASVEPVRPRRVHDRWLPLWHPRRLPPLPTRMTRLQPSKARFSGKSMPF